MRLFSWEAVILLFFIFLSPLQSNSPDPTKNISTPIPSDLDEQSQYQQALNLLSAHQFPEARKSFQALVDRFPQKAIFRYQLATLLALIEPEDRSALEQLQQAVQLEPENDRYREALADAQMRFELPETVIATYIDLLRRNPERSAYRYKIAALYAQQKDYDAALKELDTLLTQDRKNENAWALQGRIWLLQGKESEALESLQKALEHAPNHIVANMEWGKIAQRRKQWTAAEQHFLRVTAMEPFLVEAYSLLTSVYAAQNREAEAKNCREAVRHLQGKSETEKNFLTLLQREGPKTAAEFLLLGKELNRLGQHQKAQQVLETAKVHYPFDQEIPIPLAWLQLGNLQYEKAFQTINSLTDAGQWFSEPALAALGWSAYHTQHYRMAEGAVAAARLHSVTSERLSILAESLRQRSRWESARRLGWSWASLLILIGILYGYRRVGGTLTARFFPRLKN